MGYPNIALIGRARSGKDSVASRLISQHQYTRVAFADPLKEMALRIDPFVIDALGHVRLSAIVHLYGWERAKDEYPEVRRLLQRMGQTVRDYDQDFWLRIALDKAANAAKWNLPVVVTDVRYPNEAEALTRAGFATVRVFRPGLPQPAEPHESETALDDYRARVTMPNDSTLEMLAWRADGLIAALGA